MIYRFHVFKSGFTNSTVVTARDYKQAINSVIHLTHGFIPEIIWWQRMEIISVCATHMLRYKIAVYDINDETHSTKVLDVEPYRGC